MCRSIFPSPFQVFHEGGAADPATPRVEVWGARRGRATIVRRRDVRTVAGIEDIGFDMFLSVLLDVFDPTMEVE